VTKTDIRGKIIVTILAKDPSRAGTYHVPGNMMRVLTVPNAKVSTVAQVIEDALFGEE
jgi:hypothetical protein